MKWSIAFAVVLLSVSDLVAAKPLGKVAVHEWGVFRVYEDAAMANADMRAIWDGLPAFVYGNIRGRSVPTHFGDIELRDKPIVFFHATQPRLLEVKIDFPGGMPGVWWPGTISPNVYGLEKQPAVGTSLQWELGLKTVPSGWSQGNRDSYRAVDAGHWFRQLRQVRSDDIFARFGPGRNYVDREKFIYYDGLFPQRKWVKFTVEKENVSLTSRVNHPVFDITVVDRRGDGKVRIGRMERLNAEASAKNIAFVEVDASRFASEASETLIKQIAAAGLNADEAKSLADIWKKEMFETPGLHAFYRIPQEEYERLLPMTINPKPDSVVRVGLIFHAHLEPDLAERILDLVRQLDSERYVVRDAAKKKLLQIGPAALVHLQRLPKKNLSVEVQKQIEALVKQWNAKEAFE